MEQAVKVSRFADDSGIEHGAKGIENTRTPFIPYALCAMLNHSNKADGPYWNFIDIRI
jgi:hypothetical protein